MAKKRQVAVKAPSRDKMRKPAVATLQPRTVPVARQAFRFSGHQTFPLRISWLPKAIAGISSGHDPLTNIDEGITSLGLGKNMVEALRCWIEAFQVAVRTDARWVTLTDEAGSAYFGVSDRKRHEA